MRKCFCRSEDNQNSLSKSQEKDLSQVLVWQSPPIGWMKANIDTVISIESNKFGIGWVIRDNACNFGVVVVAI